MFQWDAVDTSSEMSRQNLWNGHLTLQQTTRMELERVFCRWIYFHLCSKIFLWPSCRGEGRSPPLWIYHCIDILSLICCRWRCGPWLAVLWQLVKCNGVMLLTFIIIIPSPLHSFFPGLKPSFCANHSHRSLPFHLQDWLHGFPGLFTDTSEHIHFFIL